MPAMPVQKLHIDIFTDYVCPWCYLSSAAVSKLVQSYPVTIQWVPFPLHPDTPEDGLLLDELFQGRNMDSMHEQLYARMDDAGLEHCQRSMTYNSRLAQELAQWADTQEGGSAIHQALYRAYFVHHQNIAKQDVLLAIIDAIGLDVEQATQVLTNRTFSQAVDDAWAQARQLQVTGVPCFIGKSTDAKNYVMTGCQPYEELEKFVQFLLEQTEANNV